MTSHYSPQSPEEEEELLRKALQLSQEDYNRRVEAARGNVVEISGKEGEVVTLGPGSVEGAAVGVYSCTRCRVFVLDHSEHVEVEGCRDSRVFVGPAAGRVVLRGCTGCRIAVAAAHLLLQDCRACDLLVYSSAPVHLHLCRDLRLGCWTGAYPGLTSHFQSAGLDPRCNKWNDVQDQTPVEGETHWEVLQQQEGHWWEVPVVVDGASGVLAPCDNPVKGPGGAAYMTCAVTADPNIIPVVVINNPNGEIGLGQ